MIDYDKINLAHDLAAKAEKNLVVETKFYGTSNYIAYTLKVYCDDGENGVLVFDDIDKLIAVLKRHAYKSKYNDNDIVWFLDEANEIHSSVVCKIDPEGQFYALVGAYRNYFEHEVFKTREALIQYHIDYWEGLKSQL